MKHGDLTIRNYRVSQKKLKRLIKYRTKCFCLFVKIFFDFDKKLFNLNFETKFV